MERKTSRLRRRLDRLAKKRGHLLTLCERQTRLTLAAPLPSRAAEAIAATLCGSFAALPEAARRSITFDNSTEFTRHQRLHEDLAMQTFFCDLHSAWRRGSIENTNGNLRRDLPRKTELGDYGAQDIHDLIWAINTTPRKFLGFLSPAGPFIHQLRIAFDLCIQPLLPAIGIT